MSFREQISEFRSKLGRWLTNRLFLLVSVIVLSGLTVYNVNYGFFLGIFMVILTGWAARWNGAFFGLSRYPLRKLIGPAVAYTLLVFISTDIVVTPVVEHLSGAIIDLSSFDTLRGNLPSTLIFILYMIVVAAIGEELVFRGYLMRRIAGLASFSETGWLAGALVSSLVFGLAHNYQGISGMITTGFVGFILALIYLRNREKLTLCMLIHGLYNIVGIILIYFSRESYLSDRVKELLF